MKGMFIIYGGATEFNQWELNKLVMNPCMKEGDTVVFRNSHGETYVVKAFVQDGEIMADVPNYLLQTEGNILVDLGQGLERHTECRTTFTVVAKGKPEDYECPYNIPDRPEKAGGVTSWNDLEDKPSLVGQKTEEDGETFNDYENNTAQGMYAHAEGKGTKASGEASHAEGNGTKALSVASHAEGYNTYAYNPYSHAEGNSTHASSYYSHAEGHFSRASGEASHAEGYNTETNGMYSHAEGEKTIAMGKCCHAEGCGTISYGIASHAEGKYNIKNASTNYAHVVGNGTSDSDRSNAHTLDWSGNAWFAGTVEGTAVILKSSTEGSTKRFKITVDDTGNLTATEITE